MKITVLIDNPDSWFNSFIPHLMEVLREFDRKPYLLRNSSQLKKGDILLILSCNKILPKKALSLHRNNIVVHAGDLPKNRGWSPVTWQVERGTNNITMTLFEGDKNLDAGDYYLKDTLKLSGTELVDEIREKQAKKTIEMIKTFLLEYPMRAFAQRGHPTYNRKRKPEDFELNINKKLACQFNKMRVADNERYPLYFIKNKTKYILKVYKPGVKGIS